MAAREIIWSREAKVDLYTILDYYKKKGSAGYGNELNSRVNKSLHKIAKHPLKGNETALPTVRTMTSKDCQIIYEIFDKQILVVMLCDHCRNNNEDCW
ncbi:type II toxin-antitoxin system RelE/ParE family toxin [Maribellus luteus]|uniref:Type II toxin-antitoxin system RelE/ParE family toxin n=1 Tax=Maribellus luteus TaxID=2305463 RepID=A0A399T7A7_9BACT|nr:type II toxin-antitoxin system RelE/ParE family toxin [Maribellus luteus]RIJ50067.1 type II toxin-antitoxin system RelE/ParE family toxin [Maribellus luteus]